MVVKFSSSGVGVVQDVGVARKLAGHIRTMPDGCEDIRNGHPARAERDGLRCVVMCVVPSMLEGWSVHASAISKKGLYRVLSGKKWCQAWLDVQA